MTPTTWLRRGALALGLMTLVPSLLPAQESDDATRRARARDEWYNETYRMPARDQRAKKGGPWTAQFRKFMMDAAARERAKWGALIPSNADAAMVVVQPEAAVAATGTTWVSLGPTKADYLSAGGITLNVTDTGRVRNFVTHPADPATLYVARSRNSRDHPRARPARERCQRIWVRSLRGRS